MAASKLSFLLYLAAIWAVDVAYGASHHHSSSPSPSQAVDCSSLVLNMADCLTFVSNGSTVTKPEGTCCSGLKTVIQADASCLCETFKNSAQLGIVLNVTKAMTLPAACKVSAPSVSHCDLSLGSPAGAPALSPSIAVSPSALTGESEIAPAPAPASSRSSLLLISIGTLVMGLVVASFSSF